VSPVLDKSGIPSPAGLLLIPRPGFLIFSASFRVFIKALKVVLNILKLPSSFLLNLQLWVNRLLKMLLLVTWLVVFTRLSILWLHHYPWLPATNLSLLVSFKMNCSLMSFYWIAKPLPILQTLTSLPCFPPSLLPTITTVSLNPLENAGMVLRLPLHQSSSLHLLPLPDPHVKYVGS